MNKKKQEKYKKLTSRESPRIKDVKGENISPLYPLVLLVIGITAACFFPMLKNGFTNWDDEQYVINNSLLRGPDWKGIFTQPVVSNYHPLTIITLAMNYQLSALNPFSYFLINLMLHLANTTLVFYFIWLISGKKIWVATLTAVIFGIHPMHVESVAWISERKDVLYTLFFLLSLIVYWQYIDSGKSQKYWFCFILFGLSLLSKPAAVILPVVLILLDYWKGKKFSWRLIFEKIPFFLTAVLFGIITLQIQSHKAIASLEIYSVIDRLLFGCYVVMIYFIRFIFPYPLSAFHPYPSHNNLGLAVELSPLFIISALALLWYFRRNKLFVFSILFFIINLLLVLQVISIGNTIIAERYTYVPYIGLAFLTSMLLNSYLNRSMKIYGWIILAVITIPLGVITFERTQVWRNSGTLWTDVVSHYADAPVPRTNRAVYDYHLAIDPAYASKTDSFFRQGLEDCTIALKAKPDHQLAHEYRGLINIKLNNYKEALDDGTSLIKLAPHYMIAYWIRGTSYMHLDEPEKALADFNKCLELNPNETSALTYKGTILFNYYKKYDEALTIFNKAIQISPSGSSYLNRSRCYYMLGDMDKAKADAQTALKMGEAMPDNYRQLLKM